MSDRMNPVTSLLADLVAIPSMNPMGRGRTGAEYQELSVAEFLVSYLEKESIDAHLQPFLPGRPNVIASISGGAPRTLLLEAHMDTVQADAMTIEPFDPVVRDGRLYGRGSCDTKGSIAAFIRAVANALKTPAKLRCNVILLFVSDEEYRFTGALHAMKEGLKADAGIAGEPTSLRIIRAHKGVTRWKIVTHGVAAHSAYPDRGKNAIYSMGKVVNRLEGYAATLASGVSHPLLGAPSLSVGVIEGGQAVNVVPDQCWIEIDRRTLPDETAGSVVEPVRESLRGLADWEMKEPHLSVAGMEVSEHSAVVGDLVRAVKSTNGDAAVEGAHYATDAGIYNAAGLPTIVFGPGDIAQAHTGSEYIELQQLDQAVAIIERMLMT